MPDFGSVTYLIPPKFAFPRSYLPNVGIQHETWANIGSGREIILEILAPTHFYYHLLFRSNFWAWSSNRYTADYILEQVYYVVPPSLTHNPATVLMGYAAHSGQRTPTIIIDPFFTNSSALFFPLPPGPGGYWAVPSPF